MIMDIGGRGGDGGGGGKAGGEGGGGPGRPHEGDPPEKSAETSLAERSPL